MDEMLVLGLRPGRLGLLRPPSNASPGALSPNGAARSGLRAQTLGYPSERGRPRFCPVVDQLAYG
jgi:hypothetical protein